MSAEDWLRFQKRANNELMDEIAALRTGGGGGDPVEGPPGPKGLQWRGAWNQATAYKVDDAVQYNGSSYIAESENTGKVPEVDAAWSLLAAKGTKGDPGTNTGGGGGGSGLAGVKDVRDYGTIAEGADISDALIAAVNDTRAPYSTSNRGVIWLPPGKYQLSKPVPFELSSGIKEISFQGTGTHLVCGFPDAMLKRSHNSPVGTIIKIDRLRLENNNPRGKGIVLHSSVGAEITNCQVSAWRAIETYNSQSILVQACALIRSASHDEADSIGVAAGNATSLIAVDVTAFNHAVRHHNLGLTVSGGRYEKNGTAFALGLDQNGNVFQSTGAVIQGQSLESNRVGLYARALAGSTVQMNVTGNGENMEYGFNLWGIQACSFHGCTIGIKPGTQYSQAGVFVNDVSRSVMMAVMAPSWRLPTEQAKLAQLTLIQCNN